MSEKKPCPFCKNKDNIRVETNGGVHVQCKNCYASGPYVGTIEAGFMGINIRSGKYSKDKERLTIEAWKAWDKR